ncbi:MAG: type II toxin-antitoxin system VapB family antitoxin [Bacteroidota bacterium]
MAFEIAEIEIKDGIQTVNLPEEFRINDDRVYIKKQGNMICLIPYHSAWNSFFTSENSVTKDFMEDRGDLADQERESFD